MRHACDPRATDARSRGRKFPISLTNIGASITKTAEAADAPTDHPVGSEPDGDKVATEGSFAKENAGPAGVEAAPEDAINPQKKEDNMANQNELNPTSADDGPPDEIKPKKTVTSGDDDDKGELGGPNEGSGESEGNIGGVGGPVFDKKSSVVIKECDDFLKEASAIVPEVENAPAGAANGASEDLMQAEKIAQAQISLTLKKMGVPDDAPLEQKRAAIVRAVADQGTKAATGFLLSLDEATIESTLNGMFEKQALDDPSGAMPPAIAGGDPAAAMGAPPVVPAAAMGGMPPEAAGAGAGGQPSPDDVIQQVIRTVQTGEITPEEAIQLLIELGLPPEIIQAIQAQLGGGGMPPEVAGAEAAAEDVAMA